MHALATLLAVHVLLFTRTAAFHHDSIPAAVAALEAQHGLVVDATDDASTFTDGRLARYDVVVFLLTTGDVLDDAQQAAMERFVRAGGGFAGVHSATDTEYGWAWYGRLVGARFRTHPPVQQATVDVVDPHDPSTSALPRRWPRTDEWYAFQHEPQGVHVLLTVDESTYTPGDATMGPRHPVAWEHAFDGGRAWYTAMGHDAAAWSDPIFVGHVVGGIRWAAGLDAPRVLAVARRGRVVTARVPGCRRCTATAAGRTAAVANGRVGLTLPPRTTHFTLRVVNRLSGRSTTVRR